MKTETSSLHLSPVLVFLALFFNINLIQPVHINTFNPHFYLQEHYIEYVIPESSDYSNSDFALNFLEKNHSDYQSRSITTTASSGVTASDWLPSHDYDPSYVLLNCIPQTTSPVSVHIRFMKHQSFSDCDPDNSFLI